MTWIQWGETPGEAMLMAKTKLQDHEDLLNGNADAKIEGVVPTVNRMVVEHDTYRRVAVFLNAITLLAIAALGLLIQLKH